MTTTETRNLTANDLFGPTLKHLGVENIFFIHGGPMNEALLSIVGAGDIPGAGIKPIPVRHEQAAAFAAQAYARVTGKVGYCEGCSGPGATNLVTGIANAWIDACPVVAMGGSSPVFQWGTRAFQEMDQLKIFEPITKWSTRIHQPFRVPELLAEAHYRARSGQPGPVYIDLPADTLYGSVEGMPALPPARPVTRPHADPAAVKAAAKLLAEAQRPLIVFGSGPFWSGGIPELRELVDMTGIPFYATPQGRGAIPEDHNLAFLAARSTAWREADVVFFCGTRLNFIVGFGQAPRFAGDVKRIQLDIEPGEIGQGAPVDVALVGDAKAALQQLIDECRPMFKGRSESGWVQKLREINERKSAETEVKMQVDTSPMHPIRLCKEVRDFLPRDAILVVDGHEILNFARQTIPVFEPGHSLNAGPNGCMGVGVPFGLGAKVAKPNNPVFVLHGDGSFGMNCMEMETCVRLGLPVICIVSNNAGWAAGGRPVPGRDLAHYRYGEMFAAIGCHGEEVDKPEQIRPALERAVASGKPAVVNVITDPLARSTTAQFSFREAA